MTVASLERHTYLPDSAEQVAQVYDLMAAREHSGRTTPAPRYFLAGSEAGERVELPPEVYRVLRQVIEAMRANLAVTVAPQAMTLTTQQAAELLGVSRPTVVKLLEEGKIPFERIGTHRRILLVDLLTYRGQRRGEQYAALAAMSSADAEVDAGLQEDGDVEEVLDQLRQVRHTLARRRPATSPR